MRAPLLRTNTRWTPGNQARLLENGEEFFPAVMDAIQAAQTEVLIETFILFEDKVGLALRDALVDAARRGVRVDLLVDGFGSADLSPEFVASLSRAGVRLRVFEPGTRWLGMRLNLLRRMHRKLAVIDGRLAFVGGINYSADHLGDFGPQAKQDYAVALQGPIVGEIQRFMLNAVGEQRAMRMRTRATQPPRHTPDAGPMQAQFVTRDNGLHRTDIERHYRAAIRGARERVWLANAYFFPGWRLLRELRRAARRGVDVRLILQGEPDMPIVKTAASLLYDDLQRDGVKIYEYCKRPLHGKVALVDADWSTIGSSNLDPLSLSLNLEANVILRDAGFTAHLGQRLESLMANDCSEVDAPPPSRWGWWQQLRSTVVFHVLRRFPSWAASLPPHAPKLDCSAAEAAEAVPETPAGACHAR